MSGFWTPYYTFAVLHFSGIMAAYFVRLNINVTIVAMVNQSKSQVVQAVPLEITKGTYFSISCH
jgi:hypothetical protein